MSEFQELRVITSDATDFLTKDQVKEFVENIPKIDIYNSSTHARKPLPAYHFEMYTKLIYDAALRSGEGRNMMLAIVRPTILFTLLTLFPLTAPAQSPGDAIALRMDLLSQSEVAIGGEMLIAPELLQDFYSHTQHQPAWSDEDRVDEAIGLLRSAITHGLNPHDYHLAAIDRYHMFATWTWKRAHPYFTSARSVRYVSQPFPIVREGRRMFVELGRKERGCRTVAVRVDDEEVRALRILTEDELSAVG